MDKKSRELVMGKLYFKNKDFKMAEKSFLEYLNSNPEDFQALKLLAQVYENLRNFSKAFELYERCYLAEPDRKGVLLDICRLLLMNDTRLGHVDQRKWLKLAIQTFPSNPIVVNLRETLPAIDTTPSKTSMDDEVIKKLSSMEQQLNSLQQNQSNLEKHFELIVQQLRNININLEKKETSVPKSDKTASSKKSSKSGHKADKAVEQTKQDKPTITPIVEKPMSPPKAVKPVSPPKVEKPATPVIVEQSLATFKLDHPPAEIKSESPFKTSSLFNFEPKFSSPPIFSNSVQSTNINNQINQTKDPAPSLFENFSSNSTFGLGSNFAFPGATSNLFADGLKRFNLPAEGTWTTGMNSSLNQNDKENDGQGDENDCTDDGVVNEEELPIENTCDMQTIEIKTGEEDEDIVFEQRCKLHRFIDKDYKERGTGQMKVLKHRETGKGRLIMRREMINLVCLNSCTCSHIQRVRDIQVRFSGLDVSDNEPGMFVFLAKFKTPELTDAFISHIEELFPESRPIIQTD